MKYLFLFIVVFYIEATFSQGKLDKQITQANTFYKAGDKQKAVSLWRKVESKAPKNAVNYGKAIRNLLFHYSQGYNENNLTNYYSKIMMFEVNEVDKNEDAGETFLNTKYYSTMLMVAFYTNKANYSKALQYLDIADNTVFFHTNSISNFAEIKIDLAISKYWIYLDLDKKDLALSKLIERAFEYDYKGMYKKWYVDSGNRKEQELAEMIFNELEDIAAFEKEMDNAISALQVDSRHKLIKMAINGVTYEIEINRKLNVSQSQVYIKESPFYQFIKTRGSLADNN